MRMVFAWAALVLALISVAAPPAAARNAVTVFAAASTGDAIGEVAALYEKRTGTKVTGSFAASSGLARQIQHGAPADVFISANETWMDALAADGLIVAETRADLLGNDLVLVAPAADDRRTVDIGPGLPLVEMLGEGRLAVGDPDHVPAGQYARKALESLGLWQAAAPRLARTNDARGALALVARGEAPYGIVYASDAAASAAVEVVGTFPEGSHPPIAYPAAVVAGRDTAAARGFLDFLKTPDAKSVFSRHGFRVKD